MERLSRQLAQITRRLTGSPLFAFIALVTLATTIGANTAMFAVVNGVLLKPLPYSDPDRLIGVSQTAPGLNLVDLNLSNSDYFTFRDENRTFKSFGLWTDSVVSSTGIGEPEQLTGISVTDGVLQSLGVQPVVGRPFTAKDDSHGEPETVILTYAYWQRKFGGAVSVIGRRMLLNSRAREVVGVMPASFRFLDRKPDLILPFQFDRAKVVLGDFSYQGIARLKPGITVEHAKSDVTRMIPIVNTQFPPPPGFSTRIFAEAPILARVRPLKTEVTGEIGNVLWVLMGTVGIVLLIACATVANLLLVRAEGRQHELAIRAALGAGRWQIARELLFESLFLGLVGGALGIGVAYTAIQILVAVGPSSLPRLDNISIDASVLIFTIATSLAAGLLFGLVPVLKYGRPRLAAGMHSSGRTASHSRERHRARNALVVLQVALALVLLVSSGLMIRTFRALKQVQPGFTRPEEIQTFRILIPEAEVKESVRVTRMQQDILDKINQIPGVSSASFGSSVPMDHFNSSDVLYPEDRSYTEAQIPPIRRFKSVAPGFFETMGNHLLAGRDLNWNDVDQKRQVVVVSENLARELWREPATAIGKRVRSEPKGMWHEIVGVVGNVYDDGTSQKAPTIVYWPMIIVRSVENPVYVVRSASYAIRSGRTGTESFLKEIKEAVWSVNPNLPIASPRTMSSVYASSLAKATFTLAMVAIAGSMALLLGIVGIYDVISYAVSQRIREIGVRMALGAQQQDVKRMFVRQGFQLAACGAVFGIVASALLSRLMASFLFNVRPIDPLTYAIVTGALVAAAVIASYIPSRNAARMHPIDALRHD